MNPPWEWTASSWLLIGAVWFFPVGPLLSNLVTTSKNDVDDLCNKLLGIVVMTVLCCGAAIAQGIW